MGAREEILITFYSDQETFCQIFFHTGNTFPLCRAGMKKVRTAGRKNWFSVGFGPFKIWIGRSVGLRSGSGDRAITSTNLWKHLGELLHLCHHMG